VNGATTGQTPVVGRPPDLTLVLLDDAGRPYLAVPAAPTGTAPVPDSPHETDGGDRHGAG